MVLSMSKASRSSSIIATVSQPDAFFLSQTLPWDQELSADFRSLIFIVMQDVEKELGNLKERLRFTRYSLLISPADDDPDLTCNNSKSLPAFLFNCYGHP